jgi:hypothetical protein
LKSFPKKLENSSYDGPKMTIKIAGRNGGIAHIQYIGHNIIVEIIKSTK